MFYILVGYMIYSLGFSEEEPNPKKDISEEVLTIKHNMSCGEKIMEIDICGGCIKTEIISHKIDENKEEIIYADYFPEGKVVKKVIFLREICPEG
jgi:hypothetical protein